MMEALSQKDALQIIQSLRSGTPPPIRLIPHLHVGRQRWLEGMAWYLDSAKDADLSAVRFIVGEYGSGKTHFLRMTAYMALERKFVVCEVTLREVRLDKFDTVWREMMSKLVTHESNGEIEGIETILNRWCEQAVKMPEKLVQMLRELDQIGQLDSDFRKAMRGYMQAYLQDSDCDSYLQWLKGDPICPPGVRTKIDRSNAHAMLRSLIRFLKYLGYNGLVLFLDELEAIREWGKNHRIRDANYDTLRQFVDNADDLQNFLLLCSLTSPMLSDFQKGLPSYPALWQRIGGMLGEVEGDYRAITVNLDSSSAQLTDDDLYELSRRLQKIHAIGMAWDAEKAVPDSFLKQLVDIAKRQAVEVSQPPRLVVQATLSVLENKNQNPDRDLSDLLPQSIKQAIETIREHKRKPYSQWE